jgi:hypothetical protein
MQELELCRPRQPNCATPPSFSLTLTLTSPSLHAHLTLTSPSPSASPSSPLARHSYEGPRPPPLLPATATKGLALLPSCPPQLRKASPSSPLARHSYEASPFVRPVREKLCALCLPHVVVPTARGSANRDRLVQRTGVQFQVCS